VYISRILWLLIGRVLACFSAERALGQEFG
jgi:hypothetical protein